eukprot:TRINITY_DN2884_c0_g1_i2.p1 TRINITY_DN2884_c0_g1~~TRINITY_DN2884_c0_g1_i2.p1  ORF type:complete len:475 (+),score=89.18 TRINITY_DN2884_c0_g1_i2:121-1545(+)
MSNYNYRELFHRQDTVVQSREQVYKFSRPTYVEEANPDIHTSMYSLNQTRLNVDVITEDKVNRPLLLSTLDGKIKGTIAEKVGKMKEQINKLEVAREQLKSAANDIERDAQQEFQGIIERLRFAANSKLQALDFERTNLLDFVDNINDVIKQFSELVNTADLSSVDVEGTLDELTKLIDFFVSKGFVTEIPITPDDLPRELDIIRETFMIDNGKQEYLNSILRQVLQRYHAEKIWRKGLRFSEHSVSLLESQSKLAEKFEEDLKKRNKVCFYCGLMLTEETINEPCVLNVKNPLPQNFEVFTNETPPKEYHSTKVHFFGQPKANPLKGLTFQSDFAKVNVKQAPLLRRVLFSLELALLRIQKVIFLKSLDIKKAFLKYDKPEQGLIQPVYFKYILFTEVGVNEEDIQKAEDFLTQGPDINYAEFLKIMVKVSAYFDEIDKKIPAPPPAVPAGKPGAQVDKTSFRPTYNLSLIHI